MFEKEVVMYTEIVPALNKMIEDPSHYITVPKSFYSDSENGILVMDNLKKKNYFMIDKVVGRRNKNIYIAHVS